MPSSRFSASLRGLGFMAMAALAAASLVTTVRYTGQGLHPFVITFYRCLFGLAVLVPIILRHGIQPLKTKRPLLHILRGSLNATIMISTFTALTLIPVAKFAAISYTAPLFATLLALAFLGERARIRRVTALITGFAGALIISRPGAGPLEWGVALALFSAAIWGMTMIVVKVLARTDSSLTITFYSTLVALPISFVFALSEWAWPTPGQWIGLMAIGLFASARHLAFTQAFREADITAVLPADFTRLLWAALLGYLVFAEVPDLWTWVGGTIVFASVFYIAWRERKLRTAARAQRASSQPTSA